jgi:hypothetical protein
VQHIPFAKSMPSDLDTATLSRALGELASRQRQGDKALWTLKPAVPGSETDAESLVGFTPHTSHTPRSSTPAQEHQGAAWWAEHRGARDRLASGSTGWAGVDAAPGVPAAADSHHDRGQTRSSGYDVSSGRGRRDRQWRPQGALPAHSLWES